MRTEEAAWIGDRLRALDVQRSAAARGGSFVMLNLGSGSRRFREVSKPYIDAHIFDPLRRRGATVVHADLKQEDGVDVSGDMFDPGIQARLRSLQPDVVLACNVLEHLDADLRRRFPAVLDSLLPAGAVLVITAPYSYPYHADPIDTLYRPSPEEICRLFPRYEVVDTAVVKSSSYGAEFIRGGPLRMLRKLIRLLFPFVRPKRWLSHAHRMLWLFRPYLLTGVVLRKPLL